MTVCEASALDALITKMTSLCQTAVAGANSDDGSDGASCACILAVPAADFAPFTCLPEADASETVADSYARCLVENPGMTGSGSGMTGSGSGMTGSGSGTTAHRSDRHPPHST